MRPKPGSNLHSGLRSPKGRWRNELRECPRGRGRLRAHVRQRYSESARAGANVTEGELGLK